MLSNFEAMIAKYVRHGNRREFESLKTIKLIISIHNGNP